MNGWRLAVVLVFAFGGGWAVRSWIDLIRADVLAEVEQILKEHGS
jgi:hypothetical protein